MQVSVHQVGSDQTHKQVPAGFVVEKCAAAVRFLICCSVHVFIKKTLSNKGC